MSWFPETFRVRVIEQETGKTIGNVAIRMHVKALEKNGYTLIVFTDDQGFATFSREVLEREIEKCIAECPMDYKCQLDCCDPVIEVTLLTLEEVQGCIHAAKTWQIARPELGAMIERYIRCSNHLCLPASFSIDLADATVQSKDDIILRISRNVT